MLDFFPECFTLSTEPILYDSGPRCPSALPSIVLRCCFFAGSVCVLVWLSVAVQVIDRKDSSPRRPMMATLTPPFIHSLAGRLVVCRSSLIAMQTACRVFDVRFTRRRHTTPNSVIPFTTRRRNTCAASQSRRSPSMTSTPEATGLRHARRPARGGRMSGEGDGGGRKTTEKKWNDEPAKQRPDHNERIIAFEPASCVIMRFLASLISQRGVRSFDPSSRRTVACRLSQSGEQSRTRI